MRVESVGDQLFFTTVRIDAVAESGTTCSGTGFLFAHKVNEQTFPFVVTNKHVVAGMSSGTLTFLVRDGEKPKLGHGFRLTLKGWETMWFGHPVADIDIAICPFAPLEAHIKQQNSLDLFYRFVATEMIPSQAQMENLDALESVTFIGYPNGVWDNVNFLPIARKGTTASPIDVDFANTPHFLIDASVFGGSSGSPVFLVNQGMYTERGGTVIGSRLYFLGVVSAVFYRTQLNEIVSVPIPTQIAPMAQQQEMIDLGIVIKARTVVESIEAFLRTRNVT